MPAKELLLDPSTLSFDQPLADMDKVRSRIPQRGDMEQLSGILYVDVDRHIVAGYKDITDGEFWVPGHMPGMPLMPGVIMCECAAQVCSYFAIEHDLLGCEMVGFGGLDDVRFRGAVVPGDRMVVVAQMIQVRRNRMIRARFQCLVGSDLRCEGTLLGVPIPIDAVKAMREAKATSDD
ncbi:MAG: 3-hydroxyacyl-ACP dehydratase FabZ family protein [Planctomycetota bacterium]